MRRLGPVLVALCLGAALPAAAEDRPGQAPKPPTLAPAAPVPSPVDGVAGSYAFRTHCASCHGPDGKGEGPMAANLRFQPPDLTLIAKRSGGSFPAERVRRIVDGRDPLKGHGGSDMPIWGDAFKDADTGYDEAQAKARVQSVVDYLKKIQAR
jgi:mono/diheme cytochrome c family protein